MAEQFYALGDIGATNSRVALYSGEGQYINSFHVATEPDDYENSVQTIATIVGGLTPERGEVVAASIAVAAEVSPSGELVRAGALTPWVGRNLGQDLETALELPEGRVGTPNDVVAIALSQQHVNVINGRSARGIATTLSSGWGGALYWETTGTKSDEPGHQHLRQGARCPCGGEGHAEGFISGEGVRLNHDKTMEEWLQIPGAREQLTIDITTATTAMLERHRLDGFEAEEVRWTGGIALGQPFMMRRVANEVRAGFDPDRAPAFDTVTMGEHAGLHGTLIDAQRRAAQA